VLKAPVPPACLLQHDLTGDCHVDWADLQALFGDSGYSFWLYQMAPGEGCYGESWCPDINGDNFVDFVVFALLAQEWGM
jgi:hypothetical protein